MNPVGGRLGELQELVAGLHCLVDVAAEHLAEKDDSFIADGLRGVARSCQMVVAELGEDADKMLRDPTWNPDAPTSAGGAP